MKGKMRWLYDLVMILLFVLMFNKRVISMSFHEIGGLVLAAAVVVHICINHRYVVTVTRRLFSKQIPKRTRIGYFVNVGLLAAFALIMISGVFMSKVVFQIEGGNGWKAVHYASAAVSLILIGVHVGLHWGFIKGIFKKFIKIPEKVARPMAYVMMVALLVFGSLSITTSSFGRWIAMPFTTQQAGMNEHNGQRPSADGKEYSKNKDGNGYSKGQGNGQGMGQGNRTEMDGQQGQNVQIATVLSVIATFLSIVSIFAILTYWIEQYFIRLKRKKNTVALPGDIINQ